MPTGAGNEFYPLILPNKAMSTAVPRRDLIVNANAYSRNICCKLNAVCLTLRHITQRTRLFLYVLASHINMLDYIRSCIYSCLPNLLDKPFLKLAVSQQL